MSHRPFVAHYLKKLDVPEFSYDQKLQALDKELHEIDAQLTNPDPNAAAAMQKLTARRDEIAAALVNLNASQDR